ncbi:fimbria/pilus outer membrane usher protein [Acidovorax sp. LjRoot117]|uniref:fimbria/pilus outer membrane usher protein n=1 Tax=Acidovorax sp. LjRoot117 TaxID=3342255 RepID=UPI003ECE4C10
MRPLCPVASSERASLWIRAGRALVASSLVPAQISAGTVTAPAPPADHPAAAPVQHALAVPPAMPSAAPPQSPWDAPATAWPPPPGASLLYLDVQINGQPQGQLVEVVQNGDDFEIEAETLRRMHIHNAQPRNTRLAVNRLPGVSVEYEPLTQQLSLTVPPQWLPMQRLADETPQESPDSTTGSGWLLNYDIYSTHSRRHSLTSLWSEQRYFSPDGVVSNTGLVRLQVRDATRGYVRYDTRWTRTDTGTATEAIYGDIVSGSLPWSTSVRLGGVQWSRNFGVRPDLVTYPLPQFAGQAAVPSAVDLFLNGFKAFSNRVAPGPFTLSEMPLVSGAGTASVVTTDALGRQVYTTIPFYVHRELLRPGWTDYSLPLGALRRDYGVRSFSYGRPVATGVYRQGLSDVLTLEAQAQAGKGLGVAGVGGLAGLGMMGIANASITRGYTSRSGSGWQYSAGWQYNTQRAGISLQQSGRTARFGDASTYADDGYQLPRRTRQLNLSWTLGRGAVSAGWLDTRDARSERSRIAFASYSTPLRGNTYLTVTAGRTLETGENQLRLQLTYFLGDNASAQLASGKTRGSTQTYASYQRSLPTEGGWGWNASHTLSGGPERYGQASVQYRNATLAVEGGVSTSAGQTMQWGGLAGSLGVIDGHVFAANRVHDGFALVSTQGMPDVPIMYENQLAGYTNAQGYLLVPSVPAYYPGRYAVDPLTLPPDVDIPALERRMAVSRNAGMLVQLPVLKMRTATITLVDQDGKPVPAGSAVHHAPGGMHTVVGWDGVVYLTVLHPRNQLTVRTPEGTECRAEFSEADYAAARDLVVPCSKPAAGAQKGAPR